MRFILLLVCLGLIGGLGWFALTRGTDEPNLRGAPQIEAMIRERVNSALIAAGAEGLEVDVDGRIVTLSGLVAGEARMAELMIAVRGVPMVKEIVDQTNTVDAVDPYTLSAQKFPLGEIKLEGHIPSRSAEDAIIAAARVAAKGAQVEADLVLAAGVPEGDWTGMVVAGFRALTAVTEGALKISGVEVMLSGTTPDPPATESVVAAAEGAPMGNWSLEIDEELPIADPFVFSALKTPDGALAIRGNAPSDEVAAALRDVAEAASAETVSGELDIARGMPAPEWPELVARGMTALASMESGLLSISGMAVSLDGEIEDESGRLALDELAEDDWLLQITVRDPGPVGDLTIELGRDGALAASGMLPESVTVDDLVVAVPDLATEGLAEDRAGKPVDWAPAFEGLGVILPRLSKATIRIIHRRLFLTGQLVRGFDASSSDAAVRAVFPPDWDVNIELVEALPLPEITLSREGTAVELNGVVPVGLEPDAILDAFGDSASGEALVSGGDGDPDDWRGMLGSLAESLDFFGDVTGRVDDKVIELTGTLAPGYEAAPIAEWLGNRLEGRWKVAIDAETTAPTNGVRRVNLSSGVNETYANGFWIAEAAFPVSAPACAAKTEAALAAGQINFLPSSTRFEEGGEAVLDRIASIVLHCLDGTGIRVEIAGHTDSVGNNRRNLELSEARAQAVLDALVERGIATDAMRALGYGETQPIAPNSTAEGRAQNRRIEFNWVAAGE